MASSLQMLAGRTRRSPVTLRLQNICAQMSPLEKESLPPSLPVCCLPTVFLFLYHKGCLKPGATWGGAHATTSPPVVARTPTRRHPQQQQCLPSSDGCWASVSHSSSPLPPRSRCRACDLGTEAQPGSPPHIPPAVENPHSCSLLCPWGFFRRAVLQPREMLKKPSPRARAKSRFQKQKPDSRESVRRQWRSNRRRKQQS